MTDEDMDELDMKALDRYILGDDTGFAKFTEGPRHQRSLISKLIDKKSTGLLRERLIARFLGLKHNTRMHSTTDGITTFDGVDEGTGNCYEIKAEEHTTNNPDRKTQSGQISGVGIFSTIVSQEHIDKLTLDNPIIAHGAFGDGRLLFLVKFRLKDSDGLARIARYALGNTLTEPRYLLSDWINCPTLELLYVADNWPNHMAPKCKKTMQAMWQKKLLKDQEAKVEEQLITQNNILLISDFDPLTKNHPNLQNTIPYIEDSDPQQSLDLEEIQPIVLSEIS